MGRANSENENGLTQIFSSDIFPNKASSNILGLKS